MSAAVVALASAVPAAAITWSIRVHRPPRAAAWAWIGVGCAIHAAWAVALAVDPPQSAAGYHQAIAVLAYPALLAGVLGVTARRSPRRPPDARSDAAVVLAATGVVAAVVVGPLLAAGDLPFTETDWVGIAPLVDMVLAVAMLRRVVHADHRNWTWWLLGAGFVAWGNGHAELGAALEVGAGVDTLGALAVSVGAVLLAVGALLSSMVAEPSVDVDVSSDLWWLALPPLGLAVAGALQSAPERLWLVVPAAIAVTVVGRSMVVRSSRWSGSDGC